MRSYPAPASASSPPSGRRRVTSTRGNRSVLGVVDRAGLGRGDREAEAMDRRVVAHGPQAVDCVGWDVHQVALTDLTVLALDRHDPATARDVIELVRRVMVRVDEAAARHLELAHELEVTALGDVEHLPR